MNNSIQEKICEIAKKLISSGLNHGATGNVSFRTDDHFYITPSGKVSEILQPGDIIRCSLDVSAETINQMQDKPSSEWMFHQKIFQNRSDVKAVIHTHSTYAGVVSVLNKNIPPFNYMIGLFGGHEIKCGKYRLFGTDELSDEIINTLGNLNACLMANHGAIVVSDNLDNAFFMAQELEHLAHQYIELIKVGEINLLSKKEMDDVILKFNNYGPKT